MRKIFLFIAAIVSLNMLMPQKASAHQYLGEKWINGILYGLFYSDYPEYYYAVVGGFEQGTSGHVAIPQSFETNAGGKGMQTYTVMDVSIPENTDDSSITSMDMPSTIWSVTDVSFKGYQSLESFIIRTEEPPVVYDRDWNEVSDMKLFYSTEEKEVKVYVPDGSVQAYKNNSSWGKNPIYPISEYQGIESPSLPGKSGEATKFIKDAQLLIVLPDGKVFDATGKQVK